MDEVLIFSGYNQSHAHNILHLLRNIRLLKRNYGARVVLVKAVAAFEGEHNHMAPSPLLDFLGM